MELSEAAASAVEAALGAGAEDAEAYAQRQAQRDVRVHGGEVESLAAATGQGVGVRAWIGERAGYAFATEFSSEALHELGARAAEVARTVDADEHAGAPPNAATYPQLEGLRDARIAEWSSDRIVDLALAVERAALSRDERVVAVEQAAYSGSDAQVAIRSSTGIDCAYESSGCYAYVQALADSGESRETGLGFGLARAPAGLDPDEIGAEGADRAVAMIGASKPPSRSCPVVFDPTVAASFASLIGSALGADAVQRGRSPFADRLGEEVASEELVLHDDGLDRDGLSASP